MPTESWRITSYLNNFRRHIAPYLKADMGLKTMVFPFDRGTIIKFEFTDDLNIDCVNDPRPSLEAAMNSAELVIEDRNGTTITDFKISGTHILLSGSEMFLVKDHSEKQWSEKQVKVDIGKILSAK